MCCALPSSSAETLLAKHSGTCERVRAGALPALGVDGGGRLHDAVDYRQQTLLRKKLGGVYFERARDAVQMNHGDVPNAALDARHVRPVDLRFGRERFLGEMMILSQRANALSDSPQQRVSRFWHQRMLLPGGLIVHGR